MTFEDFLRAEGRRPGCHADEQFRALEAKDPEGAMLAYARHVLTRTRTPEEDERTRAVVSHIGRVLNTRATADELRGRCSNASLATVAMLERLNVWCFLIQGSARFRFPLGSGLHDEEFLLHDPGLPADIRGHTWVVAPPFQIVDYTARYQKWDGNQASYIPEWVAAETTTRVPPDDDLWLTARARRDRKERGKNYRPDQSLRDLWKEFPPSEVSINGLRVQYQPGGVNLPSDSLEDNRMVLGGVLVGQFWNEHVRPTAP